jgi:uncharacterized protein YbjT (DUF2867 family)
VEQTLRDLGLSPTIVRPAPFMELMASPQFYPAVGVWGGERKIVGSDRPIPWVATADIGQAITNALLNPARWAGADIMLVGDIQTLGEAEALHRSALGRKPRSLPLPLWLIRRLAGNELIVMWQWMVPWLDQLGRAGLERQREKTRELVPELTTMAAWYAAQAQKRRAA